ncbi:MAG TPA: MOSC domain-containing protein [Nocardioidaceae bacterium]|nr:MOSC domain-containing protein [Nocardioidaceae bacterium]
MTRVRVVSVNVGLPVDEEWAGNLRRTAIDKHAVAGPVRVRELGLEGDQVADTKHHGGIHQAVYAFAREDLDWWAKQLGAPVPAAMFGENLTTEGIDVNEAVVGERWRIGTALLQPISVRIPCTVFKNWLGVEGFDSTAWVKRFTAEARPGPYLRVLEAGELRAGDEIVVEERPGHGVTISTMFRALTTDPDLLPLLGEVAGLPEWVRAKVERRRGLSADDVADGPGPNPESER